MGVSAWRSAASPTGARSRETGGISVGEAWDRPRWWLGLQGCNKEPAVGAP